MKRNRMCVYLDVELADWIKEHTAGEYRSFSSFLNKKMLDHKRMIESKIDSPRHMLKSETRK